MSLNTFHKFFIMTAFACCALTANWASGHNAVHLTTPWALYGAVAGMALLAPYFVWTLKKLR
jgi:hypothetical protein